MKGACSETYVTSLGLLQSSVQLQQDVQLQLQSRKVLASRLARIEVNAQTPEMMLIPLFYIKYTLVPLLES